MSLPVAHLTADMQRVAVAGHETHKVARWIYGFASAGRAAVVEVVCSCDMRFALDSKPKAKP